MSARLWHDDPRGCLYPAGSVFPGARCPLACGEYGEKRCRARRLRRGRTGCRFPAGLRPQRADACQLNPEIQLSGACR